MRSDFFPRLKLSGGQPVLFVAGCLVLLVLSLPLVYLIIRSLGAPVDAWAHLLRPGTIGFFLNSLVLSVVVTLPATLIGTLLAWLTVRTDLPGRRFWTVATLIPLAIPSYLGAYTLLGALGPRGMLQQMLTGLGVERLPSLYGLPGASLVLILLTYPLVVLSVRGTLQAQDGRIEEAGHSLGLTVGQVFRRITLPRLLPAITGGALLVMLYTLSDFGAVSMLRFDTFTSAIYLQYKGSFDRHTAALLALVLVSLTIFILIVKQYLPNKSQREAPNRTGALPPQRIALGHWRLPSLLLCGLIVLLAAVLPLTVIGYWLLQGLNQSTLRGPELHLISNSVSGALLTAVLAVGLALPLKVGMVRFPRFPLRRLSGIMYLPQALPGIVIALSLVFFGARYLPFFYQTIGLLTVGYLIRFFPLAVGPIGAGLVQLNASTEAAARSLGRSNLQTFREITLPQLRPHLLSGGALVFLSTMKELPVTLLLAPNEFSTLATRVWNASESVYLARAALPAVYLVVVSALMLWILLQYEGKSWHG